MRRTGATERDKQWLKHLGQHIDELIRKEGYDSPYDFWIHRAGDHLSRASLNYVLRGCSDPKATTLRTIARLLDVRVTKLLDFDDR